MSSLMGGRVEEEGWKRRMEERKEGREKDGRRDERRGRGYP